MPRLTTTQWGYISGDVSSFAYRPLYGVDDVVYKKDEYTQAVSSKFTSFVHRPYKVIHIGINQNAAGAPLNQSDAAITGAVTGQDPGAPWIYDIQEIKSGETISAATGPVTRNVKENNINTLAQIKTYIGTEVGDWIDPV